MSALRAYEVTATPLRSAPERQPVRPQLRALEGGKAPRVAAIPVSKPKSSYRFFFGCALLLVAALVMNLILKTNVTTGSYELQQLQTQIKQVNLDVQSKQEQLQFISGQANLAGLAESLGMIKAENALPLNITKYVAAITGEVIGGATARSDQ